MHGPTASSPDAGPKAQASSAGFQTLSPRSIAMHAGLALVSRAAPTPCVCSPTWRADTQGLLALGVCSSGPVAPPKLELIIFSLTIPSMPHASQ
jgi:hypothetical protein